MTRSLLALLLLLPTAGFAQTWVFDDPVLIAGEDDRPRYHHLDGAGRRHVAVSDSEVAVAWEDDRSGAPQVYAAIKPLQQAPFSVTYQLSDGREAYEPAVVALADGRWLAAWEQDGAVVMRVISAGGLGPVQPLVGQGGRQVTLAGAGDGRIAAVWARALDGRQLVQAVELALDQDRVAPTTEVSAVSPVGESAYQAYPAAAFNRDGDLLVAWEDRRAGHTRLFHSWRASGGTFAGERQLNEHNAPPPGEEGVGLGSGVMRVMLAVDGAGIVRTVWLDKRNAASGYAVWGAVSRDGGKKFGANHIVQDELGAAVAQWHAALAAGRDGFVAAWDDARESWGNAKETGDVLLSWNNGDAWSADLLVPVASGDGYQGSPALAIDAQGDLHLVWIERPDLESPTRLRYVRGKAGGH